MVYPTKSPKRYLNVTSHPPMTLKLKVCGDLECFLAEGYEVVRCAG